MTGAADPTVVNADLSRLAPLFREAVEQALASCNDPNRPGGPLSAKVYEALRTQARQSWLYAQGRTRAGAVVTNAPTSTTSWHGFGLAVDVVHTTGYWTPFGDDAAKNEKWFADVAAVFKATRCNWGGDWTHPDTPHMQWGKCPPSPTNSVRQLLASGGLPAVWKAVGASDELALEAVSPASAGPEPQTAAAPRGAYRSLVLGGFFSSDPNDLSVRRSIRTNNPGALNSTTWQQAYPGYVGKTQPDGAGNQTSIYRTPEHGVGAWFHLLTVRYGYGPGGSFTVNELACRYAGVSDLLSSAAQNYVRGWCLASHGALTPTTTTRLGNDADVLRLARAMFEHEAGGPSPLLDRQTEFGVEGERNASLPPD